jgi:hypothetical protein
LVRRYRSAQYDKYGVLSLALPKALSYSG